MKHCGACGAAHEDDALYCGECGQQITARAEDVASDTTESRAGGVDGVANGADSTETFAASDSVSGGVTPVTAETSSVAASSARPTNPLAWLVGGVAAGGVLYGALRAFNLLFSDPLQQRDEPIVVDPWFVMTGQTTARLMIMLAGFVGAFVIVAALTKSFEEALPRRLVQGLITGAVIGLVGVAAFGFFFSVGMFLQLTEWFGSTPDGARWAIRVAWAVPWAVMGAGAAAYVAWIARRSVGRATAIGAGVAAAVAIATLEIPLSGTEIDADLWTLLHCVAFGGAIGVSVLLAHRTAARPAPATAFGWAGGAVAALVLFAVIVGTSSDAVGNFQTQFAEGLRAATEAYEDQGGSGEYDPYEVDDPYDADGSYDDRSTPPTFDSPRTSPTSRAPQRSSSSGPPTPSWIVIAASLPKSTVTFDAALARANEIRATGISAEVLDSDRFSPLASGYWVVYVGGSFPTSGGAEGYCNAVRGSNVAECYPRNVDAPR